MIPVIQQREEMHARMLSWFREAEDEGCGAARARVRAWFREQVNAAFVGTAAPPPPKPRDPETIPRPLKRSPKNSWMD
jgi:hypothetical protein